VGSCNETVTTDPPVYALDVASTVDWLRYCKKRIHLKDPFLGGYQKELHQKICSSSG
jgi:hypothetical protein